MLMPPLLDGIFLRHENSTRPVNRVLDWTDHHLLSFKLTGTEAVTKIRPVSKLRRPCHKVYETNLALALKSGWEQAKVPARSNLEIFETGTRIAIDTLAPMAPFLPKQGRLLSAPWYYEELKNLQRIYRRQERKWQLNKTNTERDKLRNTLENYKLAIRSTKTEYFSHIIREAQSEPKELFKVVRSLISPPLPPSLENSDTFCRKVADFFKNKFMQLQVNFPQITPELEVGLLEDSLTLPIG
ncbi:hypothetical protein NDU88_005148 [Pleurodeles waltl]|uniref:Uncharacterized protein n=1 Tax=Pleurodeles waltl TaxID=8319 RepID=A0AAV7VI76_PLEWA|nr:hypothetical protein NDU88_005148 [Pleurodeles waltl]